MTMEPSGTSSSSKPSKLLEVETRRIPGLGPPSKLSTKVYFHVEYADVAFGETVRVVGSHPSLGNWEPEKGLVLATNEAIFPVWSSADPTFLELGTKVEYKYVVHHADGSLRAWEDKEGNRQFIASGTEMTIEDDDGEYRRKMGTDQEEEAEDQNQDYPMKSKSPLVRDMDKEQKLAFVRDLEGKAEIGATDTVFMLAFQLPINIMKDNDGVWQLETKAPSDGRNFAFLPLLQELKETKKIKVVNVGWPGIHVDNARDRQAIEKLLAKHDFIPVFPPRKEFDKFVSFCTSFLWPVFHDSMQVLQYSKAEAFNEQDWAAYQHINNIYANAVVPHTHESDLIWIQDYHMMMTPTFIARKLHKANIGFFLHTPFPSSDSFKTLPVREELLAGMLSADQLGFQFFAYARNFLVSCKRIYGLDPIFKSGGFMGLDYNGRNVMVKVAHFAYPFEASRAVARSDEVAKSTEQVKTLFKGKTVFACMDRCDGLSGLTQKIQAFRTFLNDCPQYKGKAVLIQYCFGSLGGMDNPAFVESLREQADAFITNEEDDLKIITKEGRGEPSIFLRIGKVERYERLGLFRAADVLLDTCVKNGLNLMPFEFIAAHSDQESDDAVAIVSEFSGCSRVLLGSLRVNPWNNSELTSTFERALTMAAGERKERFACNLQYISQNSPMGWFEDFLTDLRRARKKDDVRIESIGFGAKIRQVCIGQDFQKLPIDVVLNSYRNSKNRVFFFDNEGTLAADKRHMHRQYGAPKGDVSDLQSRGSSPNEHVLECLRTLCSDSRNTVVILSGRNREMLEDWFGSVPRIGLAAERGFYYKLPFTTGDQWHCMVQNPNYGWKTFAFEIMRQFVRRTQGSFIENKGSALVWQYRDADQHFGAWQAKELSSHLKELLFGYDVEIMEGKGYVEVKLLGIHKGVAVTKTLSKVSQAFGEADFVMCIGDDRSDEDMFEAVNALFDPSQEVADDELSTTDAESEGSGPTMAAGKSDGFLPKRQGSGKLAGGGLCSGLSGGLASLSSADFRGNLASFGDSEAGGPSQTRRFFTCTVGRKPTAAKFFLDDTDEVSELLASFKQQKDRRGNKELPFSSSSTWSTGDVHAQGKAMRVSSMPSISSLAFSH